MPQPDGRDIEVANEMQPVPCSSNGLLYALFVVLNCEVRIFSDKCR